MTESRVEETSSPTGRATRRRGSTADRRGLLTSVVADIDRRRELVWLAGLVICVVLAGVLPLLRTPRFYFHGDTQAGAVGQWYFLGEKLLSGQWPLLEPEIWRGGNFVAEGQAGLFSPLTMLIAVLVTQAGHLVVFVTVVKLGLLVVGAVGTHLLTRSYGAPAWAGFLAGLTVTVGGATRYLESPSWVTGQMIWALLPVFWWCLRRMLQRGANPAGALVSGFLIVTVGYVYGCLYIGLVVLACVLDGWLARQRARAAAVLVVGVVCALLAVTVYLPGVLTAPVTIRAGFGIVSDGRLSGDLLGILIGFLIFPGASSFVAWFVPLLAWVDGRRFAPLRRSLAGLGLFIALIILWILGPNQVGPIRWPLRVMPELVLPVAVGLAVLLSRARVASPGRSRLLIALVWTVAGGWLAASRIWTSVTAVAVCTLLVALGVTGVWWLWRRTDVRWRGIVLPSSALVAVAMALWTLVVVAVQYGYQPKPPSVDRHLPASVSSYQNQAADAVGDTLVVGDAEDDMVADPRVARQILVANAWFLNPKAVQSTYTTTGYASYVHRYCIRYNGNSCPGLLTRLFTTEPTTGTVRADLLSISSLLIYRPGVPKAMDEPPAGWRVAAANASTVTWVREDPMPTAGGVTWTSEGTAVSEVSRSARTVRLTVDRVAAGGGTVVLSRLAWPGYRVSGATLGAPTDDYLVTLQVPGDAQGREVVLQFDPPGWSLERITLVLSLLVLLGWSAAHAVRAGVRRRLSTGASLGRVVRPRPPARPAVRADPRE